MDTIVMQEDSLQENPLNTDPLQKESLKEGKTEKGEKGSQVYRKADLFLAVATILCGFLFWHFKVLHLMGLGIFAFTLILLSSIMIYFKCYELKQEKPSLIYLFVILLSSANFLLIDNVTLRSLNLLFLITILLFWLATVTHKSLTKKLSPYALGDLLNQFFIVPFSNLFKCPSVLKSVISNKRQGKSIVISILGIIVFLPVLYVVTSLLTLSDAAFDQFIQKTFNMIISQEMVYYFMEFCVGIPVALYLFGLIYGDVNQNPKRLLNKNHLDRLRIKVSLIPRVAVYGAVGSLILLYITYFLVQSSYLFSAFQDYLPSGMTYAEYARRGFFELCTVAGINLVVLAFSHIFIKKNFVEGAEVQQEKGSKIWSIYLGILSFLTMMLIVTAMSKMVLYIKYYGLTQLRVYTSWFMFMIFLVFLVILLRQFKNFNGTRVIAMAWIVGFLLLIYGNVDGNIAKYNIQRYNEGTLESLDIDALLQLSNGAVPHLLELYNKFDDSETKEILFWNLRDRTDSRSIMDYNWESSRAENLIDDLKWMEIVIPEQ